MLNKLSDRVYYMDYVQQGDRPVLGLVVGDKYSLVIDGGNSKAHVKEFLRYVKELNVSELKYLVLTHHHWDHVFGMKTMNLINIAHAKTNEKLNMMRKLSWTDEAIRERVELGEEIEFCEEHIKIEHPESLRKVEIDDVDIIFDDKLQIDLGGVNVVIEHINPDHADDSCLIHIVEEGITFMGDAMYLDMYHGPWSYTKEKLYPFLDKLLELDSKFYVSAHHDLYNKSGFQNFVKYIKEIGEIVGECTNGKEAIDKVKMVKRLGELSQFEIDDIMGFVEGNIK